MQRHPRHGDQTDARFDALLESALDQYYLKQDAFSKEIAAYAKWHIDEGTATLGFTGDTCEARSFGVVPVLTYLPESMSLAWAWANDSFPELSRARARADGVKALGAQTGYRIFEVPQFRAELGEVDELCALALHALEGRAVFKVKNHIPWAYYVVV